MNKIIYTFITLTLLSCGSTPEEKLQNLNGYWEIAMIDDGTGKVREFGMSQNIDFFEMKGNGKGVRKKVQPNVLGEFKATESSENIDAIIKEDGKVVLEFSTAFDTWTEKLYKATESKLILINEDHKIYTYRRYQPLVMDQ